VIGPDEYHESVDDNAFTNVMARWNLRRAADALETGGGSGALGVDPDELGQWRSVADALVDGYDPRTGVYEQFDGFSSLEPLVIAEVAPRRPIAADLLLGADRVRGAQVVKQADVVMLHHLVPDAVEPGSLVPNLHRYEPLTAHGSSLSPAIYAGLFARVGDHDRALDALRIAARIDLDDLTGTTAGGLHMATMGGLWQALVHGFAGIRATGDHLAIDPRLPPQWPALDVRCAFHGVPLIVHLTHGRVEVHPADRVAVAVGGAERAVVGPTGATFEVRMGTEAMP
jgi:trehalose/maltose hydrolase-like predicted phosphorylase